MSQEHRRARRRAAEQPVSVIDSLREQTVGRIGNLSETGMMLVSDVPLREDALYQLSIQLPDAHGRCTPLDVGAHLLWSAPAGPPGTCIAGLRFIDVAPDALRRLRAWIERPDTA